MKSSVVPDWIKRHKDPGYYLPTVKCSTVRHVDEYRFYEDDTIEPKHYSDFSGFLFSRENIRDAVSYAVFTARRGKSRRLTGYRTIDTITGKHIPYKQVHYRCGSDLIVNDITTGEYACVTWARYFDLETGKQSEFMPVHINYNVGALFLVVYEIVEDDKITKSIEANVKGPGICRLGSCDFVEVVSSTDLVYNRRGYRDLRIRIGDDIDLLRNPCLFRYYPETGHLVWWKYDSESSVKKSICLREPYLDGILAIELPTDITRIICQYV